MRIRVPSRAKAKPAADVEALDPEPSPEPPSIIHADSRSASAWLGMLHAAPNESVPWAQEVVDVYSGWTTRMNGLGLPVETEIDRDPTEWNAQYYILVAQRLFDVPDSRLEAELALITALPDRPFGDVAQFLIHACDALYFNDPACPADRPVAIRTVLAARVMELRGWKYANEPASLRIERETGAVVAKMLLNTHGLGQTFSYLPKHLSNRLDPLLAPLRPMLPGGPTSFVAICVLNLLLVMPRARHLDFLLEATEAWFARAPVAAFWIGAGIGRRVVEWLDAACAEQPALLAAEHPDRERIDRLLGNLVQVGVAEAHELEKKVEAAADGGKC